MRPVLLATGIVLLTFLPTTSARADCGPDNPPAGTSVVCTGVDPDGFIGTVNDFLSVTVVSGAQINSGAADGIQVGDFNTVTNGGAISTNGAAADGIEVENNNNVTNTGAISSVGNDADGIEGFGDNNTIANSGSISSSGTDADGIDVLDINTITNSGAISSSGNDADGIESRDNNTIINSGSISASGTNSDGIEGDNNNTLTNSGFIRSANADAIDFFGTGNTLNLLPGSVLVGGLNFVAGNTLNVGNGLSLIYTFNNQLPSTINTNGAPFVVVGNRLVVLDPTALSQHDEMLADLTSGIFNSIHARLNGAGGTSTNGVAGFGLGGDSLMQLGGGSRMELGTTDVSPGYANNRSAFWAQAFGGIRDEDGDGPTTGSEHEMVGGIAGLDGVVIPGVRVGAFGGGAHANVQLSFETQELDTDSYFGGVYASTRQNGWFAHAMLTAGQSDFESTREVLNNLVSTGIQTARASFKGTFISPELAVGAVLPIRGGFTIEPSVRGRYAHLSLDGFSETGAADGLTVGDRDISLWQGRAQLAFAYTSEAGRFAPRIGVEGWTSDDETISAVLIGQAISFNPGGDDDEVTGFVGATATSNLGGGLSALFDGDVHVGDDGFARAEARVGLAMTF